MKNLPTVTVGGNVGAEMREKGVTQVELAAALGMTQPAISNRLRGIVPFDINELAAIARILEVPLDRLTEGVAA